MRDRQGQSFDDSPKSFGEGYAKLGYEAILQSFKTHYNHQTLQVEYGEVKILEILSDVMCYSLTHPSQQVG